MKIQENWQELIGKLQKIQLQRKPITVLYDIGKGSELVAAIIEKVSKDSVKLLGHYELKFADIKKIQSNSELIYQVK